MLATANAAKARELAAGLAGIPYRLLALADFPGVTLPPEGGDSYTENALAKARAAAAATGALALADDSGIEVDALDGAPGVLSARYGGEGRSDAERCATMLEALKGVPPLQRSARYRCVIAIAEPG
ncbi:MAG TPA: non-canonical purine NTP pyrophosphatase, partial [Methylomirabilota bacterium]|nr:non-canonical purine NTP pyrophosphatase [Methylomirabilota bacterium]